MLWSSHRDGLPVETPAYSTSGKLRGPWRQGEAPVGSDSGHGMLSSSLDGTLLPLLYQPFRQARARLFELEDAGATLRVRRRIAC